MWQKLLINFAMALLTKLGAYLLAMWKQAKKLKDIGKKQKKKTEAVENAKTPDEIRNAHRNNKL